MIIINYSLIIMTDFIAGACVGLCQVSIGHPFDTATVLMQNKKKWFGLPFKSYYRGWRFPLVSSSLFNCTVFPAYERSLEYTQNRTLSGALAGICVTPLLYGFEVGKIRQQTRQPIELKNFVQSKGKYALLTRETLAMSTYFTMYNYAKDRGLPPLIAGGAAGLANWTLTYPLDVIKSRQIAQNLSLREAINYGSLFRGYPICATRAVLVNAANFWTYETVKSYLNDKIDDED